MSEGRGLQCCTAESTVYGSSSLFNRRVTDESAYYDRPGKLHSGIPTRPKNEQNFAPHYVGTERFTETPNIKSSLSMYGGSLPIGPSDFGKIRPKSSDLHHNTQGIKDVSLDFAESEQKKLPDWCIEVEPEGSSHMFKSSQACGVKSFPQTCNSVSCDLSANELGAVFENSSLEDFAPENERTNIAVQHSRDGYCSHFEIDNGYNCNFGYAAAQKVRLKNNGPFPKQRSISPDMKARFPTNSGNGRFETSSLNSIDPFIYAECLERATEVVESGGEMTHAVAAAVATIAARRRYLAANSRVSPSNLNWSRTSELRRLPCDRLPPFTQSGWNPPIRSIDHSACKSGKRNNDASQNSEVSTHLGNSLPKFPTALIEEMRIGRCPAHWKLNDIRGHVVNFSIDQFGSRFIQQKLETATMTEMAMLFDEVMLHSVPLATDVFGNYVIQKLLDYGLEEQRIKLAATFQGQVLFLSLHMYGCRVIQKAIEVVPACQQTKIISELQVHTLQCVRDQNGNHVIQKCIEKVDEDGINSLVDCLSFQIVELATHPYGCRVIQRLLQHGTVDQRERLITPEIMDSILKLARDPYGNYVVQNILEYGSDNHRGVVLKSLRDKIIDMSMHKFASNVIEKSLMFGSPAQRQCIINEVLASGTELFLKLVKDQYANYVVQKVMDFATSPLRKKVMECIRMNLLDLKRCLYAKQILVLYEKLNRVQESSKKGANVVGKDQPAVFIKSA